jgi:hypothetical protein
MKQALESSDQLEEVLEQLYAWSRQQGYRGYNKHDGLNSPLLNLFFGWGKWPRMIAIQGVMRFPLNLRPLILTPKVYNPKGLALFSRGLLDRFRHSGEIRHLQEAEELLTILDSIRSPGDWSGDCWGYHYPWRDPGFLAPSNTPNAVVTAFVCEAFLDAFRLTEKPEYLGRVRSALDFFSHDLTILKDTDEELCIAYMPLPMTMRVMDVSILIGSVMAQYGALAGDSTFDDTAIRLVRYVVNRQTDYAAWFYTDPPGDSHIRHDNYHTGFILDALWNYMEATGDNQWRRQYERGLGFYAEKLFNADGSPRWMSDQDYPHDIHGAAQGIITFSRHRNDYPDLPERIIDWSHRNMYHSEGRYSYQQGRYWRRSFTLLRWCNGWMARALGCYLAATRPGHDEQGLEQ